MLDSLRQPLESGEVVLDRSRGSVRYPARFQLVLAANPCPCGLSGVVVPGQPAACSCTPIQKMRYTGRLSGPLLDRIDLVVGVTQPSRVELLDAGRHEPSAAVARRVLAARERAEQRWLGTPWACNARVPGVELRGPRWRLPPAALAPLHDAFGRGRLTARGVDRVLRVAWTLADLAGRDQPGVPEVLQAIDLRTSAAIPGAAA